MATAALEELLAIAWRKIISRYSPLLDFPVIVGEDDKKTDTASFDNETHKIFVNKGYVDSESKNKEIAKESLLETLLTHETFHHLVAPYDSDTAIRNAILVSKITFDKEISSRIIEYYYEMKVHSIHALETPAVKDTIYKTIIKPAEKSNDPNTTLYADVLATRLGLEIPMREISDPEYKKAVSILGKMDYLRDDENDARLSLFARIFKKFIKEDKKDESDSGEGGSVFSKHDKLNGGKYGLSRFSKEEMMHGLGQIAQQIDKQQFKKMLSDLGLDKSFAQKNYGQMVGRGGVNDIKFDDTLYFMSKAEMYNPPKIVKSRKVYDLYQSGTSPFDINENELEDYDPINSFGQLTEPLARKKEYSKVTSYEKGDQRLGDLLIIKDTSSSMDNIHDEVTIASLVMAKAYINSGSEVSIYNFSSKNQHSHLPRSRDIWSIARLLVGKYSGGTEINISDLKKRLGKGEDVLLFTDLGIANIEELMGLLTMTDNGRVAVFLKTGKEIYHDAGIFSHITKKYKNIRIYKYENVDELSSLVINDINSQIDDTPD